MEHVIRHRVTLILAAFLLLGGNAARGQVSFELLEAPGKSHWVDFSLSRDGKNMGCLLGGAVYWWTPAEGFLFLDQGITTQGGVGMSADGGSLIAARSVGTGTLPAIWHRNGSSVDLGAIPGNCVPRAFSGVGFDLNADGTVAVGQADSCSTEVAFVWSSRDPIHGLPTVGDAETRGTAVSADGSIVVGFCEHPESGYRRPALWREGHGPVLFLGATSSGEAFNISLNGRFVVGQAEMGGPSQQAFFWMEGSEPVSLGNLSGRATDSSLARAVSDDGKVVGWSGDTLWGDQEAFIWSGKTGMQSLAGYLASRDVELPRDMVLTAALDISGDGRTVVGTCRDKDWNQGYWRIRLDDSLALPPVAQSEKWEPEPQEPLKPDTLDTFQADILNPFPFGKRRFMP